MTFIELVRQYKVGPFSIFDFVLAYGGFYLLSPLLIRILRHVRVRTTRTGVMWLVLPLSVLTHLLIGTSTPFTRMVLEMPGSYIAKAVILLMLYLGFREVKYTRPKRLMD